MKQAPIGVAWHQLRKQAKNLGNAISWDLEEGNINCI